MLQPKPRARRQKSPTRLEIIGRVIACRLVKLPPEMRRPRTSPAGAAAKNHLLRHAMSKRRAAQIVNSKSATTLATTSRLAATNHSHPATTNITVPRPRTLIPDDLGLPTSAEHRLNLVTRIGDSAGRNLFY